MSITLEEAVDALLRIRAECGAVCENFTECTHPACDSSCHAWMIADQALFGKLKDDQERVPTNICLRNGGHIGDCEEAELCLHCGLVTDVGV